MNIKINSLFGTNLMLVLFLVQILILPLTSGVCPEPKDLDRMSPKNATSSTSYKIGTLLLYECDPGYASDRGLGKSYCEESGEWSTPNIECKAVVCMKPDAPENGKVKGTIYTFGQTVEFECYDGYILWSNDESRRLSKSTKLLCSADGNWNGEIPKCLPIECPELPDIENGEINVRSRQYNGKAIYSCDQGFRHQSGDLERRCQLDETWSGTAPVCGDVKCEDPEENTFLEKHPEIESCKVLSALEPGDKAECTCKQESGKKIIKCKDDGQWEMPCKTGEETTLSPSSPSTLPQAETTLPDQTDDETTPSPTVHQVSIETTKEQEKSTDVTPTGDGTNTGGNDTVPTVGVPADSKGLPTGVIVGLIFGLMAVVIAAIILVVFIHRRKNSSKKSSVRKPNPNDAQNGIEMKSLNQKEDV